MSGIERVFATLLLAGAVAGAFMFPRLLAGGGAETGRLGLIPHGTGLTVVSAAPLPSARRHPGLTFVAPPLTFSPHAALAQAVTHEHGRSRPVHASRPQRATTPSPVAAASSGAAAQPAPEPAAQPAAQPIAQPQPVAEPVPAPAQPSVGVSRVVVTPTPPRYVVATPAPVPAPVPGPVTAPSPYRPTPEPVSSEIPLVASPPPAGESGPVVHLPAPVVPPPTLSPDDTDRTRSTESARMDGCPASASSAPAP